MLQKNTFLISYGFVAILYLLSDMMDWWYLTVATKPMLLSILFFYVLWSSKDHLFLFSKSILFALFFSLLGDCFLLFKNELFFILGLGSFLVAHLCYIGAFRVIIKGSLPILLLRQKLAASFFALLLVVLIVFLWPDLGGLKGPVLVYGITISTMGFAAYLLKDFVSPSIFRLIFLGALLFIFSDSMIALNKFKSTQLILPFPGLLVMVPYILAQLLIVEGCIGINKHKEQI